MNDEVVKINNLEDDNLEVLQNDNFLNLVKQKDELESLLKKIKIELDGVKKQIENHFLYNYLGGKDNKKDCCVPFNFNGSVYYIGYEKPHDVLWTEDLLLQEQQKLTKAAKELKEIKQKLDNGEDVVKQKARFTPLFCEKSITSISNYTANKLDKKVINN